MIAIVVIEAVVLALLVILVAGLLRAYADVLRRLRRIDPGGEGGTPAPFRVAPGTPAPAPSVAGGGAWDAAHGEWAPAHDVSGVTPGGEVAALRVVDTDHDTLLLFLSPGCASCEVFWAELGGPAPLGLPRGVRMVVVCRGSDQERPDELAALAPPGIDVVMSSEAWQDYEVPGSPYVVLVDGRTGRVRGEGTGESWRQVTRLLATASGNTDLLTGGPDPSKPRGDAARERDADAELFAAGIMPGDARLYEPDATG